MAIVRSITCSKCGQYKREARSSSDFSNICLDCQAEIADQTRRQYLAGLKGLTIEERLSKIEAWIYDRPSVSHKDIPYA